MKKINSIFYLIILSTTILCILLLYPTKYDLEINCSSGDLDFDYYLNNTNISMSKTEFHGIDDLNCNLKTSGSFPLFMILTLG